MLMAEREYSLRELCRQLDLECLGEIDCIIDGLNLCNRISKHNHIISYVTSPEYVENIRMNEAIKVLILKEDNLIDYSFEKVDRRLAYIVHPYPEQCFYDIHDYLYENTDFYNKYQFEKRIGIGCVIHPGAIIEDGVDIGNYSIIGANSVIKKGTVIGNYCEIGCNSTIGSEGFQIIRHNGRNRKIKHVGNVKIEDEVSIGDNVCVCNSLFEDTTHIGKNVKIDNLCHIGHNVIIGNGAVVTSCVSLCGSVIVEPETWIGANSTILNRVKIGKGSIVGIGSTVTRNISEEMIAYGIAAKEKGRRI